MFLDKHSLRETDISVAIFSEPPPHKRLKPDFGSSTDTDSEDEDVHQSGDEWQDMEDIEGLVSATQLNDAVVSAETELRLHVEDMGAASSPHVGVGSGGRIRQSAPRRQNRWCHACKEGGIV